MIIVTVIVITGILAVIVTGYTSHLLNNEFFNTMNATAPYTNNESEVREILHGYSANIGMLGTIGAIIGLLLYWMISATERVCA